MNLDKFYADKDLNYYSHSRPELMKFVPDDIRLALDVGCSGGNFGKLLKDTRKCQVHGIEPDSSSVEEAKNKIDSVYHGIFDKKFIEKVPQKFDCIFFNDVLEHLSDPEDALRLASVILRPRGYIVASIPNIRWYPVILGLLRYKDFKYTDAGVMDKTHLKFFTEKSMIRLFETSGYKVEVIEGINREKYTFLELANALTFNYFNDMRYPQFGIRAQLM